MKDLPYFKFFPNQWLTGSISFLNYDQQGAFIKICCYYWSKECKVTFEQYKTIVPNHFESLLHFKIVKKKRNSIVINWLDEQYTERKIAHQKRVAAGRLGGKQSSSNAQAFKKNNIKKDNYANNNVLRVNDDIKKLLKK
tara:strand:- start:1525 stop:1941 length:417 start_codon:yes stop_codon:yes gene_type:complete